MEYFEVRDLEIIKNAHLPLSTLKRQMNNMIQCSENCVALVESINQQTGEYRIILQGKLEKECVFSSY